jgi:hypothetical protein
MNAVKDRNECSLARREAGTDSRVVEDMTDERSPHGPL